MSRLFLLRERNYTLRAKLSCIVSLFIMPSIREHLYHPFGETSFGVSFANQTLSKDSSGFLVSNIDLYYQPVVKPEIGVSFLLLRLPLLLIGEFLYMKVIKLMKKETSLVNDVTKLVSTTQMIFWPFWLFFSTSTDFIHPINTVVGQWYCTFGWFIIHLCYNIISFNSFIVAIMRYYFIVHVGRVEVQGKKQTKRFFLFLSFFIPLLLVVWDGMEGSELDVLSFINKCYGEHHRVFLIETSTLDVLKRNFCEFDVYERGTSFGVIIAGLRRLSCITKSALQIIMGTNLFEGFIYFVILSHMNR